jgi:hypothetical protein
MSEWYSHLDARNIADVVKAQAEIAGTKKPEKEKPEQKTVKGNTNSKGLKLVKLPKRKSA